MDPIEWIKGNDTGISSETIWTFMTGLPLYQLRPDVPYDPSDFGRCYRLLNLFPEWKHRMTEFAEINPRWKPFVREWDRMTKLYERDLHTGRCQELFELMQKLVQESYNIMNHKNDAQLLLNL